jgi:hypothetical protein
VLKCTEAAAKILVHWCNFTEGIIIASASGSTAFYVLIGDQDIFRAGNVFMATMVRLSVCEESARSCNGRVDQRSFTSLALSLSGLTELVKWADDLFWGS